MHLLALGTVTILILHSATFFHVSNLAFLASEDKRLVSSDNHPTGKEQGRAGPHA